MAGSTDTRPVAPCGHRHQLWDAPFGHRSVEPALWRVTAEIEAYPTAEEGGYRPVLLPAGTLMRHDQSDLTFLGCLRCEGFSVWERFAVLDGPAAGRCVEFQAVDPREDESPIPAVVQPA